MIDNQQFLFFAQRFLVTFFFFFLIEKILFCIVNKFLYHSLAFHREKIMRIKCQTPETAKNLGRRGQGYYAEKSTP